MDEGEHEEDAEVDDETGEMDVVVEGTDNDAEDERLLASDKGDGENETEDSGLSRKS